ncbi:hypothetical protein PtrSN002B_006621 [Pyrenophora tritici-repentis]|uniref:Uncharacterized protein n=2 Tax=Pyrenophora tritici-repentis TaxID=45151 RepID=A0A2W1DT19_9PLEO|nr:uncharacterized protein PTRG_04946 [Pyrenophora tritici-repentis Pt-1C-BFP]KAA8611927.1 hypothetical protein PtrV1_13803 [Pyrenophora tritici-repentis]EDU47852.1 predicted protein [Pyrenophora tritici-repentis Pt-1C-BFP]KAF7447173.1 hypothetical protein A1F99_086200 [Pyrenophora tritici-repentis]KAF7569518.1 hypothetical protein PtrM4_119330 [Pyrenophora tritici-repentis]KAG9382730.1 hypothetical protein A1F94_006651 [Pyrenophora tritici-repentis]
MRRTRSSILLFIYKTSLVLGQIDNRVCYDTSNNIAKGHRPCISPTTQEISHCCSTTDTCIGDTLCLSQFATLYVGSCTIKDWKYGANGKGICPKYCNGEGYDIAVCKLYDGWEFCCGVLDGGAENCCRNTRFLIAGNVTSDYIIQRPWELNQTTPADTSPSSSLCPAVPESNNKKINYKTDMSKIGIAAGLGVPLLIALGLLFWENRKRRIAEARLVVPPQSPVGGGLLQYGTPTEAKPGVQFPAVQSYEVDGLNHRRNELSSERPMYELGHEGRAQT